MQQRFLQLILAEGEGQKIEFKEKPYGLAPVMVAFANSTGGRIFVGVTDDSQFKKLSLTNRLKSQITDIARNCDPSIKIKLIEHTQEGVVEIVVNEGMDKPYQCKEGFFLRIGPNTQKLTRDEIVQLIRHAGKVRFDEVIQENFRFPQDWDKIAWERFVPWTGLPSSVKPEVLLENIGVTFRQEGRVLFSNAAVLFFAKNPQQFFPEAKITCLKYRGNTRTDIADRREFGGVLPEQLEGALAFFDRYNAKELQILNGAQHQEWEDYPKVALREILTNALVHRDYFYDSSHIYLHMEDNQLEVTNPGGFLPGMNLEDLGSKAARRNRMVADLMQRAGFIENASTGIARIKQVLEKNNNPSPQIVVTNFFTVRLTIRPHHLTQEQLSERQKVLYSYIVSQKSVSTTGCQKNLNVGSDTILKELKILVLKGLVGVSGKGKNTRYSVK